jgi:hypothetical protein
MGHRVFPPWFARPERQGARAIRLKYQHTLKDREALLIVFIAYFVLPGGFHCRPGAQQ